MAIMASKGAVEGLVGETGSWVRSVVLAPRRSPAFMESRPCFVDWI